MRLGTYHGNFLSKLSSAFVEADAATLGRLITDDYIHVNGSSGNVVDREQWLSYIASRRRELEDGVLVVDSYEVHDVEVRLHDETAIVVGIVAVSGTRNGQAFDRRIRFTNVWVEQDGAWRRAAFHDSRLP